MIAVFTKFDALLVAKRRAVMKASPSPPLTQVELREAVEKKAEEAFEKFCLGPLRSAVGQRAFPYVRVSSQFFYILGN